MSLGLLFLLLVVGSVVLLMVLSRLFTRGSPRREQELSGVSAEPTPGDVGPERDPLG